jgi:hypothetical protein
LGGFKTPGLAVLDGIDLAYEWEVRKGNAVSGASKFLKGRGLTKATVKVTLYTEQEIAEWEEFISKIRYPEKESSQTVKGYDITHPLANLYGIKAMTVTRIMPMEQQGDGSWTTGLELEEYREPVVVVRKASGTRASPHPNDADPIANNPELAAATKELERQRALNKAAGI